MGGVPCIRGMRFPVQTVLRLLAGGMTAEQVLAEHPDLEAEDIAAALSFAAEAVHSVDLPVRVT